jgi:hypothetical protein
MVLPPSLLTSIVPDHIGALEIADTRSMIEDGA